MPPLEPPQVRDLYGKPVNSVKDGTWISSPWPSGVNVLMGDHSVRTLANDITTDNLRRLLHRNDGEVIEGGF